MVMMDSEDRFKVWWVNQGQTYARDKAEGYIWAPIPVAGGTVFEHWVSMTKVRPGDIVINASHKDIVALSIAKDAAQNHVNRKKEGWRIDLDYHDLAVNISLEEIKPYMDELNGTIEENRPFNSQSGVNHGYLFNFSVSGLDTLIRLFPERIPESVKPFLGLVEDTGFRTYMQENGFHFDMDLVRRYTLSLLSHPFVVLSGRTGTGKTTLALLYARYLDVKSRDLKTTGEHRDLFSRRWFKMSYNDKSIVNAFDGPDKKINLVRKTMLKDGIMPLYAFDSKKNIDMEQKRMMKELVVGDVIIAYEGGYTVGGIGIVTQPHFTDSSGDAFDSFQESTRNFIRVEWIFKEPVKTSGFFLDDGVIPAFNHWSGAIFKLEPDHVRRFADYLAGLGIKIKGNRVYNQTRNHETVQVGGNWSDKSFLLGKVDESGNYRMTKALELIIHASHALKRNEETPYFLILEDLNASQPDHYLSELLNAAETGGAIALHTHDDVEQFQDIPKNLLLPSNLHIVGTLKSDSFCQPLSRKLLDRANVIELEIDQASMYLNSRQKKASYVREIPFISPFKGKKVRPEKLLDAMAGVSPGDGTGKDLKQTLIDELDFFQTVLTASGSDMGLRVIDDIIRYMYLAWAEEDMPQTWSRWRGDFDVQILQRILPLLCFSEKKIQKTLKTVYCFCFPLSDDEKNRLEHGETVLELFEREEDQAVYPRSAVKLKRMMESVE